MIPTSRSRRPLPEEVPETAAPRSPAGLSPVGISSIAARPHVRLMLRLSELAAAEAFVLATLPSGSHHLAALIAALVAAAAWLAWIVGGESGPWQASVGLGLLAAAGGVSGAAHSEGMLFVFLAAAVAGFSMAPLRAVLVGFLPALGGFVVTMLAFSTFPGRLSQLAWVGLAGVLMGIGRRELVHRHQEADELALAQRRTALADREARLARERNRLGREIHDVLAHTLSAVSVQLTALDARVAAGDPTEVLRGRVRTLHGLVSEGLEELRDAVRALRDDTLSLQAQIERLCAMHNASLSVEGTPRALAAEAVLTLYRVVQEALTNAEKHAPGASLTVQLVYSEDAVTVRVDNSAAVSEPAAMSALGGGQGLVGMRERVELAGGSCRAGPHDLGWRVAATLPIP